MESVTADLSFWWISSAVSVIRMRDRGSECDFDILRRGSWRDMTRFAGASESLVMFLIIGSWAAYTKLFLGIQDVDRMYC